MCKQALCVLSLSLIFILGSSTQKANAQYADMYDPTFNDFYDNLANYGQWIEDPQYGYVWSPDVDGSFRPYYTNGYWVMTEYGNTWVSDYQWGWACFHYGRWTYDNYYGWLWIPGSQWGPSWVSWRYGDGFYGWAPLGPTYTYGTDYMCPDDWWIFIPPKYLYTGGYYRYWYGPRNNTTIISNTTYITNVYTNNRTNYISGPRKNEVEAVSHQPVQVYKLANSRGQKTRINRNTNVIKMYHPMEVKPAGSNDGQRVSPPNVVSAPQPIRSAQSVKADETTQHTFKTNQPRNNGRNDQPGANINETATPQPRRNDNENPYEYDVNRPVQQPERQNTPPAQQPQPRQNPTPRQNTQPAQPPRQQPQQPVQQQAPRQQPQQQTPTPVQQQRPVPTQTPATQTPTPVQRQPGGRK